MPADCGMALLVVQHLDPSRPSLLTDILSRHTPMHVAQATDDTLIEIDHVYVIPPNTSMSVHQGRLRLKPRAGVLGPPMPVDDLLESLAKDQGANAIGVVLSGAGTDGAIGMRAVKGCGGITFAQDEATARFGSMPRAAVGLGYVDLTLPPAAIAEELTRMARHPYLTAPGVHATAGANGRQEDDGLRKVFRKLHAACNIDFSHYKRGTVERRLARRLAVHALDSVPAYLKVLESDPAEAHALCRDLLIRYTEFFRDPDAFVALADTVFPRLLHAGTPAVPLRLWVPGCSTGEEVYSIAICLMEYLASHSLNNAVQIFGTDISDEALETARAGRYIENIARNVSTERLNRFFVQDGDYFRVAKSIRDCCTFARQNVAYDPPFSRIDLISCRNLLIYLDPILQKRVMPAFHFALQRDGVLMLGSSETVGAYSDLFNVIESRRAKLFGKKLVPNRPFTALALPTVLPATGADPGPERVADGAPEAVSPEALRGEIDRVALAHYAPACVLCDDDFNVLEFRGDTGPFLVNPPGPPTNQLQRLARPGVFLAVSETLRQVRSDGVAVCRAGLIIELGGRSRAASVKVVPLQLAKTEGRWFLVFFLLSDEPAAEQAATGQATLGQALKAALVARIAQRGAVPGDEAKDKEIARLGEELRATREQTRLMLEEHEGAIEELKALEEETQSSNEEFQSTNEELETAKEELESLNEELSTTNDELRFRNRELKAVHDAVTQSRDYADAIIDTMSQPLLVLDADLRVVRANHAFYSYFGVVQAETLQVRLYSLGDCQWDIPALRELLEELLPRSAHVRDYEITSDFPRIGRRTLRLSGARIEWPDHALILLTIEDVTLGRMALEKLTETDRQKDEFLAMLAHELRNPLAAMSNALHLWKHKNADEETKRKAHATMERQLRNQVRMVDDLLDVSRVTRGLIVLRMDRFDFAQVVRQAADALFEQIAGRRHELVLALPPDGMFVTADSARLEQVVTNLIVNAVKYTLPGGRIEVALQRDGSDAVLTVADNGIGMTEEFLNKIFNVFVQAERSADQNLGGLGIGLAIVRRLVELHGGTVRAESKGLSHGSRFIVRLPEAPAGADQARSLVSEPGSPASPASTIVKRRVLVVDDDIDAGDSTAALLALEGHEVRLVHDGPSALREVHDFRPDAVLLDIAMPGMDGYEVCRQLRSLADQQHTLVVAVSGYGQLDDVERASEAGFDHHVTKPADPKVIAEYLRDAGRERA
ncbi:CheR family methyltransferase [Piscinibacter sp.]|uniref:CheR family methyltransferase n=1 Tax=Piscinibacter sp. TaxID=1903157 RepID=UPI002D7E3941|nr:CheR family methyltransferase [Albitalea sp.]